MYPDHSRTLPDPPLIWRKDRGSEQEGMTYTEVYESLIEVGKPRDVSAGKSTITRFAMRCPRLEWTTMTPISRSFFEGFMLENEWPSLAWLPSARLFAAVV